MINQTKYKTVFRYPGDPTVRAVVMGNIEDSRFIGKDGIVFVKYTASGPQNISFQCKLSDLLYKYEYEVKEWIINRPIFLSSSYIYCPYIPLQL